MDAVSAYSFTSLGWLGLQAAPLIIWPSFIVNMLSPEYHHFTPIESYFARSVGFANLVIGLLTVCLSGAVPLTSELDTPEGAISPYAGAVVLISALHHASSAFYGYIRFSSTGETGFALGLIGSATLACFGLWVLMFADGGHISKRTGADKRTSGFPFKNTEAEKRNAGKKS